MGLFEFLFGRHKTVAEIDRESVQFTNASVNNDLRRLLEYTSYDCSKQVESANYLMERADWRNKLRNGRFVMDDDVKEKYDALLREAERQKQIREERRKQEEQRKIEADEQKKREEEERRREEEKRERRKYLEEKRERLRAEERKKLEYEQRQQQREEENRKREERTERCIQHEKRRQEIELMRIERQKLLSQQHSQEQQASKACRVEVRKSVDFDAMDGWQFEKFCAEIIAENGYENVSVTSGSGDQGIDVIAWRDGVKYGIQCKCYSSVIGNKAIQEVFAGKAFYQCHVGVVLTNSHFTQAAMDLAKCNGIVLWDREILLKMIEQARSNE